MKQFVLFLLIIVSLSSNAQKLATWDEVKFQRFGKETIYKTKTNKLLNGYYKIATDKGTYSQLHFNDGKINGTRKDYNSNEDIICERHYKNGKPHGKWKYYDTKGEIKTIENYLLGNKNGEWWAKIIRNNSYYIQTEYYENDNPIGVWIKKWENGYLEKEKTYFGKGSYVEKEYHNNEILYKQKSYKDFKLDGIQLVYSKSNILIKRESYKNDILSKKETFFDSGRPNEIYRFKNGKPHGKFIDYKHSGVKSAEGAYENGDKSGLWKQYFGDKGWLYFETTYKNDTANGPHKTYYRSGTLEKEGNFLIGSRHGIWKIHNKEGELTKEIEYDRGTEINRKEYNNK